MLRPNAKSGARKPPVRKEEEEELPDGGYTPAQQRQIVRGLKQEELEEYFKEQQNEGVCFRRCMLFVIVGTVFFLLWLKWDRESIVAEIVPEKIVNEDGTETIIDPMDKYYEMFNIDKNDKNRRQQVEEAFKKQKEELEKEPSNEPDHDKKLVAINDAYNALSTHVVNDYHKVLNINKRAGYHDVKKAYMKAKQEVEEGKSNWDLAEIKEAYDIMSHPEARVYYNLYGAKPPALMKHQQKVTHGGWGVEIGMGTFKYAIIMAWFDYFDNPWVEVGFFVFIIVVLAVKVWNNRHEFMEKLEQLEAMERMAMEGR